MYKPIYESDGKDKAVSPIIATILIVAITVVLAATLYAVISGYGGIIGKSTPTASGTVKSSGTTYTITVSGITGNLSLKDCKLQLTTGNGATGSGAIPNAKGIIFGPTGTTYNFTVTATGGGSYLTGLSIITITNATTSATVGGLHTFRIVDTSTGGTVFSWPS